MFFSSSLNRMSPALRRRFSCIPRRPGGSSSWPTNGLARWRPRSSRYWRSGSSPRRPSYRRPFTGSPSECDEKRQLKLAANCHASNFLLLAGARTRWTTRTWLLKRLSTGAASAPRPWCSGRRGRRRPSEEERPPHKHSIVARRKIPCGFTDTSILLRWRNYIRCLIPILGKILSWCLVFFTLPA